MNYIEALGALAADPHIRHYRRLTSDDFRDLVVRDAWREKIVRMATGQPDPPPEETIEPAPSPPGAVPVSESIRASRIGFQKCWFSAKDDACGCSGVRCHLLNRIVTLGDCVSCLRRW